MLNPKQVYFTIDFQISKNASSLVSREEEKTVAFSLIKVN